jgi:NAD(P)-dependent dehydrogenase (short-subunit alcohol dehydrogenase family)
MARWSGDVEDAREGNLDGGTNEMQGLRDRVIVIAGGATGMGAATALRLAREGARVVVGDIELAKAQQTARAIEASGARAVAVEYDQSDEESVANLISSAADHFGSVNGLYANAADLSFETRGRDGDLLAIDVALWERTMRVNLIGFAIAIRSVLPHLCAAGGGSIVCTSADATRSAEPDLPAYTASKAGVNTLVRYVAAHWGKEGIRCNAVSPGLIMSERAHEYIEREGPALLDRIRASVKSPRLGQPEDIAGTVAFLLSDDAEWINGQVWSVNGGAYFRE